MVLSRRKVVVVVEKVGMYVTPYTVYPVRCSDWGKIRNKDTGYLTRVV